MPSRKMGKQHSEMDCMKIVIDLQACQSGSRFGGIGRYSLALAKALVRQASQHRVYVMLNSLFPLTEFDLRLEFDGLLDPSHFLAFHAAGPVSASDPSNHGRKKIAEQLREDVLRRLNPDIVHVSSLIEGWGDDVVTSIDAGNLAHKTAVTWYDLIPYVQPEMYLADPNIAAHYYSKVDEARNASLLMAISQYSADEACEQLGMNRESVINISSAVDEQFRPTPVPAEKAAKLRRQFGITRKFLMYTGSFDARKNQAALIEAFAQLPAQLRHQYQLVIAGNGWDGVYASLREVARKAGLSEDRVVFTGRVSDDQLFALYNLCHLFVFPSLREGFGLPALEAMACGTPAIGSNCTSVPEVIGRPDALFDPHCTQSISHKMTEVLTNDAFHQELTAHGLSHSKNFSWDTSAKRAIEGFEALHERNSLGVAGRVPTFAGFQPNEEQDDCHQQYQSLVSALAETAVQFKLPDSQLLDVAVALEQNETACLPATESGTDKPRVGWITTWNTRCGIASYSQYLVEASRDQEITVFAERSGQPTKEASTNAPSVVPCWSAGETDSLDELSRQIDAHDIDTLVIQVNYGFFNFGSLNHFVARQRKLGRVVLITLHSTQDPPARILKKRLADLRPALENCQRVFVHTQQDSENLQKCGVERNVTIFPHAVPNLAPARAVDATNTSRKNFVISTYGFFLPHKGLLEIIDAFSVLAMRDRTLHLQMVNAEYSPEGSRELIENAKQQISSLGLAGRVSLVTDYLEDRQSLERLHNSDLIVFPYQKTGESSSAAVRMGLASRRLVAVTPLSIFEDVASSVIKLPGTSPQQLADGMGALIDRLRTGDDEEIRSIAEQAEAWRRRHCVQNVGNQLSSMVRDMSRTGGRSEERTSSGNPSARMNAA